MSELDIYKEKLLRAVIETEKDIALDLVTQWASKNSFKSAFTDLLEPVLTSLGNLWYKDELSLAQAFLAGKVAEEAFNIAVQSDEFIANTKQSKGNIVLGNIEDDFHSFGRKLVSVFLRISGWTVHDLGNDVSAEDFVNKAIETNSRVIGVSAMIYNTAKNISRLRQEIDARNLNGKIQLAVGGAVFILRPELVEQVGADGTAENAINASDLFVALQQKSIAFETEMGANAH